MTSGEVVGLTTGAFGSTVVVVAGLTAVAGLIDATGAGVTLGLAGALLTAGSPQAPKTAAETAITVDKTKLLIVIFLIKIEAQAKAARELTSDTAGMIQNVFPRTAGQTTDYSPPKINAASRRTDLNTVLAIYFKYFFKVNRHPNALHRCTGHNS